MTQYEIFILGYNAGFLDSGEGWNGEYPYDEITEYEKEDSWCKIRDNAFDKFKREKNNER